MALNNPVTLAWFHGHSNVQGKETADEYAKAGVGPELRLKVSLYFFITQQKEYQKIDRSLLSQKPHELTSLR